MAQRVVQEERKLNSRVRVSSASFPKPFPYQLEYNCPVHEHWNIVHTGMLIPQTHAIYVGPDNCLRGVIMTADEWKGESRFSAVMPTEEDAVCGRLEQVTIDGVSRIIDRLPQRPKAILVFLVCMHHFLGCDEKYIYRELERRYPDIHFLHCWMDPVMQKIGLTPEQKQRREMMLCIRSREQSRPAGESVLHSADEYERSAEKERRKECRWGSVLGDDYRLPESSDIVRILRSHGICLHQVQDAKTYAEYEQFGEASFYLTRSPLSVYGLKIVAKRDSKPWVYLPPAATYEEIAQELEALLHAALPAAGGDGLPAPEDSSQQRQQAIHREVQEFAQQEIGQCEAAFAAARAQVGTTPVTIDSVGCVRPLSTARLLLSHGFHVTTVYLDAILPEEKEDFLWLQANAPDLILQSTSHPQALFLGGENCTLRGREEAGPGDHTGAAVGEKLQPDEAGRRYGTGKVLAIGPKAAYFGNTPYFVNQIESGGNWGFDGIRRLLADMCEALEHAKSPEEIVQRKGLRQDGSWELPDPERPAGTAIVPSGMASGRRSRRETYRITPVLAGDVSGVCSALYELGGMIVMHDPSGCNSTYNTHDEIRWYAQKSSIYISGLNERDAILGNDEKLIGDILRAVEVQPQRPKFLALCNSPLPFLNGTDFNGICRVLEKRTGIPAFYVKTNGFHDYTVGAGNAYLAFARKMLPDTAGAGSRRRTGLVEGGGRDPEKRIRVGILGLTPLDYGNPGNIRSLKRWLTDAGFETVSAWSFGCSNDDALRITAADVLLVVSASGRKAAAYLWEKYRIPAVFAAPVPGLQAQVARALRRAAAGNANAVYPWQLGNEEARGRSEQELWLIGEPVLCESMRQALRGMGQEAQVLTCVEESGGLPDAAAGGRQVCGEEELTAVMAEAAAKAGHAGRQVCVIADPLMQPVMPEGIRFVGIPTLAYSGRIGQKAFPDYFEESFWERYGIIRR